MDRTFIIKPMMLFEFDFSFAEFYPYSFSFMTGIPKYISKIPFTLWLSFAYAVLFLGIAYTEFKWRRKW